MPDNLKALATRLSEIRLFLLDLDGTVYLEDQLIPGALEFIAGLREKSIEYVFLTNNSSKNSRQYFAKLTAMGFPVAPENVFTSGQATAMYLTREKPAPRIYLVGTQALHAEMADFGIIIADETVTDVDFMVIGFDRELTYQKLEHASLLLDRGVPFIATNPDLVCPIRDHRYLPDCGSMCAMLQNATNRQPTYIGKPNRIMVDLLVEKRGVESSQVAMIGDRLYTDIALGRNAGITTICVLSGESTAEQVANSPHQPDYVIDSIDALNSLI
jgi:4-nitrophenyl phosphatase